METCWKIRPNEASHWNLGNIQMNSGKRCIDSFESSILNLGILERVSVDPTKHEFLIHAMDTVTKESPRIIDNDEDNHRILNDCDNSPETNVITLFETHKYAIQCSYNSLYNYINSNAFNYYCSATTLDDEDVYGDALIFKVNKETGTLITLTSTELISLMASLYLVSFVKLSNYTQGKFEEISIPNFSPEIDNRFRGYHGIQVGNWTVLSENKEMLEQFKTNGKNNLNDFKFLIFIKTRKNGVSMSDNDRNSDMRGLYSDCSAEEVTEVFFQEF